MRRLLTAIVVFGVACGGVAEVTTSDPVPPSSTTGATDPGTGTTGATNAPTTPPQPSTTLSDRPLAPDFTLALGDGGAYTLSEGAKPVFMVFWAEW